MKWRGRTIICVVFVALGVLTPVFAFAYEAAPRAQTIQPTFVTEKSIQVNGLVNPNEMPDTYQWFEWGIVGQSATYETRRERLWGGNWQMSTNAAITGLAPGMQYFFRQVAENGRGRDVGQTGYVTTKPLPLATTPVALATTNEAVFVGEDSAMLRGYVSPHGNTETQVWFEWGVTTKLENDTSHRGFGGNSGSVEVRLDRLMPGTLYYFRVAAENSAGRTYGTMRVLLTRGTQVVAAPVVFEQPKDQYVPDPTPSSYEATSRTTTTSGEVGAPAALGAQANGLPVIRGPGDFFSYLFGGKKRDDTSTSADTDENTTDEEVQLASAAASDSTGDFWGMLSGKKLVEVVVEKIGEKNAVAHTPVEYRIAYAYRKDAPATDGRLKIVLPPEVVYIGDNTNNELLIENGSGQSRTYVLPLGKLEKGETRSLSILGMVTAGASELPNARVRLEYTDGNGTHVVPADDGVLSSAEENVASTGGTAGKLLPSSLLGWIIYICSVIVAILGIRKLKEYYARKKELLAMADDENEQLRSSEFFPESHEVTPVVSA
ncbi:MAG: hypothetical protein A3D65_00510 [Candidatus Lloydbacteria bacterium RIFCSPHIGHO2_02_FULL_50_13]|uniref:Fibronectin type-III domain-containing protein n=1 Tax=Candidatus Lloydbacteria bacterium RIFCSPHIGHO2_02_FULL_50_13 TaxID=1798661 RepID=A0A1G2DAS2_9BACT|nr:MAG: hypothetical protein A3D65_00510 [Candidatus Lloydbacteria bacterium RIFCSPHIGHO2_02_FULL_50_13]